MNVPHRRFNNDLKLAICIHNHSAAHHKELNDFMRGLTEFYCNRMRTLSTWLDIKHADSIDDGLGKYGLYYDHILFVAAGVHIYDSTLICDVADEIRANPSYFCMAHVLDWTDDNRWWELHEQFVLVNTSKWFETNCTKFGGFEKGEKMLPIVNRSDGNFHDHYTPLSVSNSGERKVQRYACPGWNFIDKGYELGLDIYTWQEKIRLKRTYYYPEHESEMFWRREKSDKLVYNQQQFLSLIDGNTVANQVWLINSESMYMNTYGEEFNTILLPASGFRFLDVYQSKAKASDCRFVFYDFSDKALDWIKHIHTTTTENIHELINSFEHKDSLIMNDFERGFRNTCDHFNLSLPEGYQDNFWLYIREFRQDTIELVKADIVQEPNSLDLYITGKTLLHISNIFATDWLIGNYGFDKAKALFSNFVSGILTKGNVKITGTTPNSEFKGLI